MNKVVFITGGGMGIGAATAKKLHDKGASVALFDINVEAMTSVQTELGERCIILEGNVCSTEDLEIGLQKTADHFGRVDAVFANAGVAKFTPFVSIDEEEWQKIVDINLNGVWRTLKAATPYLLSSKGYVLVTSSASSTICVPLASHYSSTKAAVLNLAEVFRTEMYGFGIEVGTIHPMFIRTAMVEGAVYGNPNGQRLSQQSKLMFQDFPLEWVAESAAQMILKRKRRRTVPIVHLPIIWLPRLANKVVNLIAFRKKGMRALMEELASENLKPK